MRMEENSKRRTRRSTGRKPKTDPAVFRYGIKLTSEENGNFELLFEKSGMKQRARFIKAMIFGREMKVVRIDKALLHQADKFLLPVPGHRQQLQPDGEGCQVQFRRETGVRPAPKPGESYH